MMLVANVVVALVALIHLYFLVLEMFLWDTPKGRRTFGLTPEFSAASRTLAANQGLYTGSSLSASSGGSRSARAASGSRSSSSPVSWWRASSAR
jgi:uncharacterized membrane protein